MRAARAGGIVVLALLALAASPSVPLPAASGRSSVCTDTIPIVSATASSALSGSSPGNAIDGDPASAWSSATNSSAAAIESITYTFAAGAQYAVDYVWLTPAWSASASESTGFPVDFTISYSTDGSHWASARGGAVVGYAAPGHDERLLVPLKQEVSAAALRITATRLRDDGAQGEYAFQLAEAGGGCNRQLNPSSGRWRYEGNDGSATVRVDNVGSGTFDPTKLAVWHRDRREPMLAAKLGPHRDIYAAQAQWDAAVGQWLVFFGGWDGSANPNDAIYETTTPDFLDLSADHHRIVGNGDFLLTNNPDVVQVSPDRWMMVYTDARQPAAEQNITGYATSRDGMYWTPSEASPDYVVDVAGYPGWLTRDVNGSNVIYDDGGIWHFYFVDLNSVGACQMKASTAGATCVRHATGSDGVHYTYQGVAASFPGRCLLPNDLKRFTHGSSTYFLLAGHCNGHELWYTLSTDLDHLSADAIPILRRDSEYLVSVGWVAKDNRLYGALYGSTQSSTLCCDEAIYAIWLQKDVSFQGTGVDYGRDWAEGPDVVHLDLGGDDTATSGTFTIRDSDGSTVLYTTPAVTLRPGDRWLYVG
jgi:hypothetical protein